MEERSEALVQIILGSLGETMLSLACVAFLLANLQGDPVYVHRHAGVKIGEKHNEIRIDAEQLGLCFTVDENGSFWLTDVVSKTIKAFDNKGDVVYTIAPERPTDLIVKLHIFRTFLVVLTSGQELLFYNKFNGILASRERIRVDRAIWNSAYFYDSSFFLPQAGSEFPSEDVNEFLLTEQTRPDHSTFVNVEKARLIRSTYDLRWDSQFLPLDSASYAVLGGLNKLDFKGQSNNYILVGKVTEEGSNCYYMFSKQDLILRRIGVLSERRSGVVLNIGWGRSSVFAGGVLYFVGVKYSDMRMLRDPQAVVISKMDLNDAVHLPVSEIKEIIE